MNKLAEQFFQPRELGEIESKRKSQSLILPKLDTAKPFWKTSHS